MESQPGQVICRRRAFVLMGRLEKPSTYQYVGKQEIIFTEEPLGSTDPLAVSVPNDVVAIRIIERFTSDAFKVEGEERVCRSEPIPSRNPFLFVNGRVLSRQAVLDGLYSQRHAGPLNIPDDPRYVRAFRELLRREPSWEQLVQTCLGSWHPFDWERHGILKSAPAAAA